MTANDVPTRPLSLSVGSLCSGYGGLDLALALTLGDIHPAWFVEYDKHPSAILAHRFPGVPNHGDVKTTDWTQVEPVDWLTAGYPCQPFSLAGLRKGADDPRHLWPGVAHAISVLRPANVMLEKLCDTAEQPEVHCDCGRSYVGSECFYDPTAKAAQP